MNLKTLLRHGDMTTDEIYMRRCIQLAKNGMRHAAPNPMVGAVVVYDGRIIGEGYHVRCGEGHAEVNALASVSDVDAVHLPESTIYVSLEPCAHYGKTPPCARLIVEKGLKRCVVGCIDPFSKVQGRGIEILREAGIDVTVGVLEDECRSLNKRFITFHSLLLLINDVGSIPSVHHLEVGSDVRWFHRLQGPWTRPCAENLEC